MAHKNKAKGYYHERKILDWLLGLGLSVKRQPLSGALGGEYRGDITIDILGRRLVGEIKYRDKSNFPSPFTVLEQRDLAIYKRRTGEPGTLVILSEETFVSMMEKINDTEGTDRSTPEG